MKKILKPVSWWYNNTYLDSVFHTVFTSTHVGSNPFENMWYPVKVPTQNGMPDEYSWYNAGIDSLDLSELYDAKYDANYIIPRIGFDEYGELDTLKAKADLISKIESVARLNIRKYYKLIELNGFVYNPLFNVDGVELYSILQNEGSITNNNNPNGAVVNLIGGTTISYTYDAYGNVTSVSTNGDNTVEHYVNADDANDSNKERLQSKDKSPSVSATDYSSQSTTNTTTHGAAKNKVGGSDVDYTVDAKDNAFGTALTGGDYYRAEKKLRQGNIGVTKTQELIASEQEILRFNIIDEFFKDINDQILVGLYDI